MKLQVSMTIHECKAIIAKGIKKLPIVSDALLRGRIIIKGGTTTSAISEEICGEPLCISGRLTPKGALTARIHGKGAHSILIKKGKVQCIDDIWDRVLKEFTADDVYITGANAVDASGLAAIAVGVEGGGAPTRFLSSLYAEGANVIVAVGTEKIIPGNLKEIIQRVGRRNLDLSYGAALGLFPIFGRIFTEIDAIKMLADVECYIIAKGGLFGMEGGSTFLIQGKESQVKKINRIYQGIRGIGVSGVKETLPSCEYPNPYCKLHLACIHNKKGKSPRKP